MNLAQGSHSHRLHMHRQAADVAALECVLTSCCCLEIYDIWPLGMPTLPRLQVHDMQPDVMVNDDGLRLMLWGLLLTSACKENPFLK